MELKNPKEFMQELNTSTKKIMEGMNKNVKELTESKNLKELAENVQEDFSELYDLTKKIHENNMSDARSKVLQKTEELQEKIQKFHDFIENSISESEEPTSEETATQKPMEEVSDTPTEETSNNEETKES